MSTSPTTDCLFCKIRDGQIPASITYRDAEVLAFKDNKGTTIELFKEWSYLGRHEQVFGAGPLKLGHVAFVVPDVHAVADFYQRILGFRVSDWIEEIFVFMRCNPDHHTVNFVRGKNTSLHHFAFQLRDFSHLENGCDVLSQNRIPIIWGPLRHGPGHNVSIYHRNPDQQVIEFFAELDQILDEEIGIFDEAFFQVNEDVDWCVRARKLGYRVVYVDTAAIHHQGASSADLSKPIVFSYGYFLGRNAILFARKHANGFQWIRLLINMALGIAMRISFFSAGAVLRAFGGQSHFVNGIVDGFSGRLRRDRITIRMPVPTNEPPDTPLIRLLRWLGA